MKKAFSMSTILLLNISLSYSQGVDKESILNSSGGQKVVNNNTYEWSFGEMMVINTATTPNLHVTQGLLQPAEEKDIGIKQQVNLVGVKIFPNPATDKINIQLNEVGLNEVKCTLYDLSGKLLIEKTINANQNNIQFDITKLASGAYFLTIQALKNDQLFVGDFKILKN